MTTPSLSLGYIPLTDCALLAVAKARGLFEAEGLDVHLSREASWANIRDKVVSGVLDGAHMLAPMALAMTLGAASGPIELVGGMLLLIGLFTRSAAFIASGPQAPTSPRSPAAAARMRCSGIIHSFKCSVHCHKCLGERLLRRAPRGGGGGLERPGQHVCRELCRFSTPMAIKYGK
jgi:hypothetical protein